MMEASPCRKNDQLERLWSEFREMVKDCDAEIKEPLRGLIMSAIPSQIMQGLEPNIATEMENLKISN